MTNNSKKHHCTPENAPKFLDWIANRGGIAVWKSIDLSDLDRSWSSPATVKLSNCPSKVVVEPVCPKCFKLIDQSSVSVGSNWNCQDCGAAEVQELTVRYPKPHWKSANQPRIITDPADVEVMTDKEVKRFRVGIRRSSNGMSLKVTDAGTRRIREAVGKAGDNAYYEFDYETQEAVIYAPDKIVPLSEWRAA